MCVKCLHSKNSSKHRLVWTRQIVRNTTNEFDKYGISFSFFHLVVIRAFYNKMIINNGMKWSLSHGEYKWRTIFRLYVLWGKLFLTSNVGSISSCWRIIVWEWNKTTKSLFQTLKRSSLNNRRISRSTVYEYILVDTIRIWMESTIELIFI